MVRLRTSKSKDETKSTIEKWWSDDGDGGGGQMPMTAVGTTTTTLTKRGKTKYCFKAHTLRQKQSRRTI